MMDQDESRIFSRKTHMLCTFCLHFFKTSFQFSAIELDIAFSIYMSNGLRWPKEITIFDRVDFLVLTKSRVTIDHQVSPGSLSGAGYF